MSRTWHFCTGKIASLNISLLIRSSTLSLTFFSFLLGGYIVFLLDNLKGDRNHLSSCGISEWKNLEYFHYKHVTLVPS